MAETGIAARASFDLIRYAQVWEDADVLRAGLRVQPGETVVSIASAGDNVLALLTADPGRIVALDLSDAQLQCLRLRMAAYVALDHSELLELMGSRPSARRGELFDRAVARLPEASRSFWRSRRQAVVAHGLGGIGKFERYFRIFRRFVLPLVHDRETVDALLARQSPEARIRFFDERWNGVRWRLLLRSFFSRAVMSRLGRDPAFFDYVEGSVASHVGRKTRQALTEQDPSENPYLHWILTGTHGSILPLALRPESFDPIRARLDRIEIRRQSLEAYCDTGQAADAYNLSDIFEYMSPEGYASVYGRLVATAARGARLLHWSMMAARGVPDACAAQVRRNAGLEATLKKIDKAFFYSDITVAEVDS